MHASLAQSVERKALNLVVAGSSPAGGAFSQNVKQEHGGTTDKKATGGIEPPTLGLQDQCSTTELNRLSTIKKPMTLDGIEPPLMDLESIVLPLHHRAFNNRDMNSSYKTTVM